VSEKIIPDIFNCNSKKDHLILIISDTNISNTISDQMTTQFSTAPTVCFCTTWGNKINELLLFYPNTPVQVFPGSAKTSEVGTRTVV